MKALGIGKIVRNLKFEKTQGYTLTSLFISLLIMRLWGKTIASATSNHFHGLCAVSKNTLYRALLNARIDWRMLLTEVGLHANRSWGVITTRKPWHRTCKYVRQHFDRRYKTGWYSGRTQLPESAVLQIGL